MAAETLDVVPNDSLVDWVSYADAVVVFKVVDQSEIPRTPEELEAGEGAIMRRVTVEVRDTIWRRDGAPEPPAAFAFTTWGWAVRGDERKPMGQPSGSRLELGRQFLAPIADLEMDGWSPIGPDTTFEWTDGQASLPGGGEAGDGEAGDAARSIDHRNAATIQTLLAGTEPDPLAVEHAELGPAARYQAVADARRAAADN